MKSLLSVFLFLSSVSAFANTNIVVSTNEGPVTIAWLGSDVDESKAELLWGMDDGQQALIDGSLCFNGDTKEVVKILKSLDNMNILGDEYRIQKIKATKSNVKYEVLDGPNEQILSEVSFGACQ